jgi:hypothetical protein
MEHLLRTSVLTLAALPNLLFAQSYADRIIYNRETPDYGTVWINDGLGSETLLLAEGNLAKVDKNGRHLAYLAHTYVGNEASGGSWNRLDAVDGSDHFLFSSGDYLIGYDMLSGDSSYVISYGCGLGRYSFNGAFMDEIINMDCFDDAPDVRDSDNLIVFHNINLGLHTLHLDGTQRTLIPNTGTHDVWPVWSPDGAWILFGKQNSTRTGILNFYRIKANGDSLTAITFNDENDSAHYTSNAVWNGDGHSIICAGHRQNSSYGLMVIADNGVGTEYAIATSPGDRINYVTLAGQIVVPNGINDHTHATEFNVWPVPSHDQVRMELPATSSAWTVVLTDAEGRVVERVTTQSGALNVHIADLAPGVYAVVATNSSSRQLHSRFLKE